MMHVKKKRIGLFLMAAHFAIFFTSCATEKGLYSWEGDSDSSRWVLTVNEQNQASLSLPYGEGTALTGEAFSRADGSWIFHMDYLEWFSNWSHGWTEARFSVVGSLSLVPQGEQWQVEVLEMPEIQSVLEGQIRYKENRFYGDRSRDMVSRRWTRIQALTPFLQESLDVKSYEFAHKRKGYYSRGFLDDAGSLLFPELYGFREGFSEPSSGEGERYVRAEGVLWDTWYSKTYVPEELIPVRDSGTLFRDYEEGADLLTLAATWKILWEEEIPASKIHLIDK